VGTGDDVREPPDRALRSIDSSPPNATLTARVPGLRVCAITSKSGTTTPPGGSGGWRSPRRVTVETPALLPVVNPNVLTIEPRRLAEEFGAEMLITNSYIIRSTDRIRDRVLDQGLHDFLGFDGAIMTDSGSFQLAEYGDIDVTTEEIIEFQRQIGSDVATPVDVPTPPDVDRERAERELETTKQALADAEAAETGDMLVNAPVQGRRSRTSARRRDATRARPIWTCSRSARWFPAELLPLRRGR